MMPSQLTVLGDEVEHGCVALQLWEVWAAEPVRLLEVRGIACWEHDD